MVTESGEAGGAPVESAAESAESAGRASTQPEGQPTAGSAARASARPAAGAGREGEAALLIREGDLAADYLEALLDIADLDGDIDLDVANGRATVSIVGERLNDLVGAEGEVLEALQELTRLAVAQQTGERSRLMLDIAGWRERRRAELAEVGRKVAESVRERRTPRSLDPMTPFERKIVHDAVAQVEGVRSESEGEEPNRRVVIFPVDG